MKNLRPLARNRECTVRLPGICNHDPSTTVLAHFRMSGISGFGVKPPDIFGAHACSSCHEAVDRRAHLDLGRDYVRMAHLEGVLRTQASLIEEGVLKW